MIKVIFIVLVSSCSLSGQVSLTYDEARTVDRQLKSMLKMVADVDSLMRMVETLSVGMDMRGESIKSLKEANLMLFDSEQSIRSKYKESIDSLNHYRVLDYGNEIKIELYKERIDNLNTKLKWKEVVNYFVIAFSAFLGGALIL